MDNINDYVISWRNDGTLEQKDVGTSVTFTGKLCGNDYHNKVIGEITAVSEQYIYAKIFAEYYQSLIDLGYSIHPITFCKRS